MPEPLALFLAGGAANGKSSAVRGLFRTDENPEDHDLPELESDRWCGPDRDKRAIDMFTNAPGDKEAIAKFGIEAEMEPKLGGASGPANRTQFERYPPHVRDQAEALLKVLGVASLFEFANQWLPKQNADRKGENFGAGLTHELSKAIAHAKLMRCLEEREPDRPFVWDAIGNPDNYITWIERARSHGIRRGSSTFVRRCRSRSGGHRGENATSGRSSCTTASFRQATLRSS